MSRNFNIRIYGIWQRHDQILLSHEQSGGLQFTKFPGGGLEPGEGIADALDREFDEELGVKIISKALFFINENFVQSAFDPSQQLISIYYKVEIAGEAKIMQFEEERWGKPYSVKFEWTDCKLIHPDLFYFPVDKMVAEKLMQP